MNISMVMIDPMIGTKQHRAGGAIYALHTYMKVNNKYINDINTEIFNFNSLYKGAANFYATAIVKSNPDIVAFSTYCWNIDIVIDLAHCIKSINPNTIVILGGPEVSYNSKELLEEYFQFDIIIRGEGEETFNQLIEILYIKEDLCNVDGITYRDLNCIVENKNRQINPNLDLFPSVFLENGINLKDSDGEVAFETVRGCKFACSYCLYTKGLKYVRYYSDERIEQELKLILLSPHIHMIWFIDPTFNADENHAIKILKIIEKYNPHMPLAFELRAELLTDKLINQMSRVNVAEVGIGVQTSSDEINKNVHRLSDIEVINSTLAKLKKAIGKTCEQFDMDLIYGLPGDSYVNYKKSIEFVLSINARVFYQPLRIFHGTMLDKEKDKYNIKYNHRAPYNILCNDTYTIRDMQMSYCINVGIDFINRGGMYKEIIIFFATITDSSITDILEKIGIFFWDSQKYHYFRVSNWTPDDRLNEIVRKDFLECMYFLSELLLEHKAELLKKLNCFTKDDFYEYEMASSTYSTHGYFGMSI